MASMFSRKARRRTPRAKRSCDAIGLGGVTEVSPLEAIAGEYEMPDVEAFSATMMRTVEDLIEAGSLDAGNGEALDARIDMELERACARLARQHAENEVMLDRIEASLRARLREIEVRDVDVSQRLAGARDAADKMREASEAVRGKAAGDKAQDEGRPSVPHTVVRLEPRAKDASVPDMKEASNA